mgnify:FL=1
MSSKTLEQLQSYKALALAPFESLDVAVKGILSDPTYQFPNPDGWVGIEVEVENAGRAIVEPYVWYQKQDGSLRNHGTEWVSYPLPTNQIEKSLMWLYRCVLHSKVDFSVRTSIHIHLNVRNMTLDQILSLIIAYMAVEKLLFKFEGTGRYKSIFCVPLEECSLLDTLQTYVEHSFLGEYWMKYTAFNLCPITSFGTIEFRHMHGTKDVKKIMDWIALIQRLEMYARTTPSKEMLERVTALNTNSMYNYFVRDIFREHFHLLNSDNLKDDMEYNVMQIKYSLSNNSFSKELWINLTDKSPIYKKIKARQGILKKNIAKLNDTLIQNIFVDLSQAGTTPATPSLSDDFDFASRWQTISHQHPNWNEDQVNQFLDVIYHEWLEHSQNEPQDEPQNIILWDSR